MAYADFRHRLPLRVRWAEVDLQGVVFNGHYLTYCDVCVAEYWRAIGLVYPAAFVEMGADTFVRKAVVEYHGPAVYDDELEICGRTSRLGRTSLVFAVEIYRSNHTDAALVNAELVYVNADPKTRAPMPWPDRLRDHIHSYEITAPESASSHVTR